MSKWIPIHEYDADTHGKAVVCARLCGDVNSYRIVDPRGLDQAWSEWTHFMPIPSGPTQEDVLKAENQRLRKRIAELEKEPNE